MEPVQTQADIEQNLRQLETYLHSTNRSDQEFVRNLIRLGRCFVVAKRSSGLFFGPSRFVGYQCNSRAAHEHNNHKDGKVTNPAIADVLRQELVADEDLEQEYHRFCERVGIEYRDLTDTGIRRRYWALD